MLHLCRTQGSSTAFIRPEYLLPPELYNVYVRMRETTFATNVPGEQKDAEFTHERTQPVHLSPEVFETVSKKTWVDVLMQILKVFTRINDEQPMHRSVHSVSCSVE